MDKQTKIQKPQRIIRVSAKCSDGFWAVLDTQSKREGEYTGYVPTWFPNPNAEHDGDYVSLDVDLETGQILNWKKPTAAQLEETFNPSEE